MAPNNGKRKRGDRTFSYESNDGSTRPSPHRPGGLSMAQHNQYDQSYGHQGQQYHYNQQGQRGGRRNQPRGGRGGSFSGPSMGGYQTYSSGNGVNIRDERPPLENPDYGQHSQQNNSGTQNASTGATQRTAAADQDNSPPAPSIQVRPLSPPHPLELQPPQKSLPPYDYQTLTNEHIERWHGSGRQAVIATASQTYREGNVVELSRIFQEILRAGLDERLAPADAGKVVEAILQTTGSDSSKLLLDGVSLFLDTLSVLTDSDASNKSLKPLLLNTGISPAAMREQLEEPLLQTLGLIRPTFGRVFIRKQTNVLYRQSNYNLLREESEGYSKLITELFTTTNNGPPSAELICNTFENMRALIGAFDLDVGRVLDVTLDVFASTLVKQYRFFVKLLRASSWWPQGQDMDSIQSNGQPLDGLPYWADPGYPGWTVTDEHRNAISQAREQRDKHFWKRAQEIGLDAFFELGGRQAVVDEDVKGSLEDTMQYDSVRKLETQKWIKTTRTLPPRGNPVAAQLLGFKLRFYASAARDSTDALPVNLIYLAALLIKIGFISLRDLYTHLYPPDDTMEDVKERQLKEKEEREQARRPGGGVLNALARAGALADDTLPVPARPREADTRAGTPSRTETAVPKAGTPSVKGESEEQELLPEPADQKVQLLRSLLCIGAIPEALYLLGRFPWLPDAFTDLPEHIHRILHHCLHKVYEPLRPVSQLVGTKGSAKTPLPDPSGLEKSDLTLQENPPPKVLRWAKIDRNDTDEGIDYRFYWDDWTDNVPVCQDIDDVFTLCNTLLNFSGVRIGQDTTLLVKLARIGKHSLTKDLSESNQTRWIDLCKRLLAPALTFTKANPGVVNEIYDLLKFFPTKTRYGIYAEWFTGQISRLPDIATAFEIARLETKDILKRVSKTNTKPFARNLAKISCASPGIVFSVILTQIEAYQNLIDIVVECGRYFTYMGYDVLTWTLIATLGRAGRQRISEDGISTSKWLISLATFSGKIFKRYSTMSTLPVLQYVLEQLLQGNFTDLRVLREMIITMAGITPDTDFSDAQVQAMAGGELLQAQTLMQVHDRRHESRQSAKRLMKTILEHSLAAPLLISIARERQTCIFNPNQTSLKVISENFDDLNIVMTQYLEMLRTNIPIKDFDTLVPDVIKLISEYGVHPEVAFTIHRKVIARAIDEYDIKHQSEKNESRRRSAEKLQANGDVLMTNLPDHELTNSFPLNSSNVNGDFTTHNKLLVAATVEADVVGGDAKDQQTEDERIVDVPQADSIEPLPTPVAETTVEPWHPVIKDLMEKLKTSLSVEFETTLSLSFFVNFWQLSLNDMFASLTSYEEEIKRQRDKLKLIKADRTDLTAAGIKKKELDIKATTNLLEGLQSEMKVDIKYYGEVRHRLQKEKDYWFASYRTKPQQATLYPAILQECFLPRLVVSPVDAFFTYKMLFYLHSAGAKGFSTMRLLDRMLGSRNCIINVIFQCTQREADNFGRFINEVLGELGTWRADSKLYTKKAHGPKMELPGFAKKMKQDGSPDDHLDYEDFRRLLQKWHHHLLDATKTCLQSGEYMHMKNAIIFLSRTTKSFPAINWMGSALFNIAQEIVKQETHVREDLMVAANSLMGALKSREKEWMLPQAFYINETLLKNQNASTRQASAAPSLPQSEKSLHKSLNASAPEFAPRSAGLHSVDSKFPITGKLEDGEVEDADMTDAQAPGSVANTKADTVPADSQASAGNPNLPQAAEPSIHVLPGMPRPGSVQQPDIGVQSTADGKEGPLRAQAGALPVTSNSSGSAISTLNNHTETSTMNRVPHVLPNRPEVPPPPRGRFQDRLGDRFGAVPSETPDSRGRTFAENVRMDRQLDTTQRKNDDNQGLSPARFESTTQNEQIHQPPNRYHDQVRGRERDIRTFADQRGPRFPREFHEDEREMETERNRSDYSEQSKPPIKSLSRPELGNKQNNLSQTTTSLPPQQLPAHETPINPERARLMQQNMAIPSETYHSNGVAVPADHKELIPGVHRPAPNISQYNARREDRQPIANKPSSFEHRNSALERAPNGPREGGPSWPGLSNDELPSAMGSTQPPPVSRSFNDRHQARSQDFSRTPRHQDVNYGRLNSDAAPPHSPQAHSPVDNRGNRTFFGHNHNERRHNGDISGQTHTTNSAFDGVPQFATGHGQGQPTARVLPYAQNSLPTASSNPPVERHDSTRSGIHPSRIGNVFVEQPAGLPPIQTSGPTNHTVHYDNAGNSGTTVPSGPRSSQHHLPDMPNMPPIQSSSMVRNLPNAPTPTGPASPQDRLRRGNARQFAGLQETLQQAGHNERQNDRGASIRGRATAGRNFSQGGGSENVTMPSPMISRPQIPYSGASNAGIGSDSSRHNDHFLPQLAQMGGQVRLSDMSSHDVRHRDDGRREKDDRGSERQRSSRDHSREKGRGRERERSPRRSELDEDISRDHSGPRERDTLRGDGHRDRNGGRNVVRNRETRDDYGRARGGPSRDEPYTNNASARGVMGDNEIDGPDRRFQGAGFRYPPDGRKRLWQGDGGGDAEAYKRPRRNVS